MSVVKQLSSSNRLARRKQRKKTVPSIEFPANVAEEKKEKPKRERERAK